jgi:hypothetical protein
MDCRFLLAICAGVVSVASTRCSCRGSSNLTDAGTTDAAALAQDGNQLAGDGGPCPAGSLCELPDGAARICCDGRCVDNATDPLNCGSCGTVCPLGGVCQSGFCGFSDCTQVAVSRGGSGPSLGCSAPGVPYGICCGGTCIDDCTALFTSANCGGCGLACPPGTTCQGVTCATSSGTFPVCSPTTCPSGWSCVVDQTPAGASDIACVQSTCTKDGTACPLTSGAPGVCCSGSCVDTLFDSKHCMGCGGVCPAGTVCELGACLGVVACDATTRGKPCALPSGGGGACCASACADIENDPQNCGACGVICTAGAVCIGGTCVEPVTLAAAYCNPDAGTSCAPGTECLPEGGGSCVQLFCEGSPGGPCAQGVCCASGCTDLGQDPQNCGACGNVCPSTICTYGICYPSAGTAACAQTCPPGTGCVNGSCFGLPSQTLGMFCALPEGNVGIYCDETGCEDLADDPNNCGGCAVKCPSGQTCVSGGCSGDQPPCLKGTIGDRCDLDAGFTSFCCPGAGCVDLTVDLHNCGYCGNDCTTEWDGGISCVNGNCLAVPCPAGSANSLYCELDGGSIGLCCFGFCADTSSDPANCGLCTNACPDGGACAAGQCQ